MPQDGGGRLGQVDGDLRWRQKSQKGTLERSLAGCDTRNRASVLDRRLMLPTCSLPHAAPEPSPLRGFVVPVGRGLAQSLSPPHHQGTAKVLKIPPRCLNSSWEQRRRRRAAPACPWQGFATLGRAQHPVPGKSGAQHRPESPPVPKGSSLRREVTRPRVTPRHPVLSTQQTL